MNRPNNSIYDLKLNELVPVSDPGDWVMTLVTRVPGGWIYSQYDKSNSIMGSCFVPFDNEFIHEKRGKDERHQ